MPTVIAAPSHKELHKAAKKAIADIRAKHEAHVAATQKHQEEMNQDLSALDECLGSLIGMDNDDDFDEGSSEDFN